MFSTLLGPLPAIGLAEIEGTGLELLATGVAPAGADLAPGDVVDAWRAAADATGRPVKQVLAGPYSAGRDGPRTGPADLADALAATIEALTTAGCPFIEIDEPDALAIAVVDGERRRFVDAHRRLTAGVTDAHLSLALSGGNHDAAGASTLFDLPYASYAFDLIAGPDDWRLIALAPHDRGIVCGAMGPGPNADEALEVLIWAARYAASTGGRGIDRVGLANAPSLAALPTGTVLRKLARVAEAARLAVAPSAEAAAALGPGAFGRGRGSSPP
jgi:Cobalamin-independent synthase, N-terminal domain